VYVYDTPGIMLPYIRDMDVGMKLAMCGNDVVPVLLYTLRHSTDHCSCTHACFLYIFHGLLFVLNELLRNGTNINTRQ